MRKLVAVLGVSLALTGLALAAGAPAQWPAHGGDHSEQRYSPLKQINVDTVGRLGLAWHGDLAERGGSYETTPVVADGRIFVTAPWSKLYAFDARTGKQLWKYDPKVPGEWAVSLCCGIVNRGAAVWRDKVIWGTLDGRLVAVDAKTGDKVWERQVTDRDQPISFTGAPRIANGLIFLGMAGGEFHQRGYFAAYSAEDGRELWRWWTVPGDPSLPFEQPELGMAAKTWTGEWWKFGGGGTTWDGILYDPRTDLIIFGTGNGAPWPAAIRSPGGGDNLFTASIVALEAKTGKYRWHYQVVPQDSWDYDNTQQLVTADLVIDGQKKHVVMQATKSGVFPVIEVATGKVLHASLYVPAANWMKGWDDDWRPILDPAADYGRFGDRGMHVVPSAGGAHSWHPMAFSPDTGYVYIPTSFGSFPLVAEAGAKMGNQLLSINVAKRPQDPPPQLEGAGNYLLAWDPVKRREAWRQPEGSARSGVLATGGNLVFQGGGGRFNAFRADTGERVWSTETQANIVGGAASYEIDGRQYIAVVAAGQGGFGGGYWAPNYARLLVYALDGKATLPAMVSYTPPALNPPPEFGDAATLARGQEKYVAHCATCHGNDGRVTSLFPDLRYAAALNNAEVFRLIVIDGVLTPNGMVSFRQALTPEDAEAIRAYVVRLAHQAKNAPPAPFGPGGPPQPPAPAPAAPSQPGAAAPTPAPHQ